MGLVLGLILFGFVLGVVAVVAAEALGVFLIIKRLGTEAKLDEAIIVSKSKSHEGTAELDPQQSLTFADNKQGVIWVLESDKIPEIPPDKPSKDKRRKKEILEVSPVKKYGKIKGQSLILTDPDGLQTKIQLKGCIVEAVSATSLPSKKWAKKFPIKVESKTFAIYNGRKSFYVYLETSWDKEAWCKALRLASCDKKEKVEWFAQLHKEFLSYLASLNAEYNTYLKPTVGSSVELVNRAIKPDGASSKVQKFLKKIAKKSSRVGMDNKSSWSSLSGLDERKNTEKLRASQDADGSLKNVSMARNLKHPMEDNASLTSATISRSGSQSHASISSDIDSDDKFTIDEGTLCWNLLISRLFFDARNNAKLKGFIQAKIQNTLSSMRTPSYVGEIICTGFHTGNLPPCIVGMRVLPMEMSEVWGFEVDIEYSGGALLDIETRLEVGELDNAPGVEDSDRDSPDSVDVPSDLLQGLEDLRKHLNLSDGMGDSQDPKEDDFNTDISKNVKSATPCSTHGSRWKSIVNSIARQVSQVPLSLTIGITSLRGTLRLQIKPPPSDQLWYGFTSMPDIDLNLESSIGEHKITTGHIALFLINRIKGLIREALVVPNCESVCVSWMLAEKDDWIPQEVAPFKWVNQESRKETSTLSDAPTQPLDSARDNSSEHKQEKPDTIESGEEPCRKSADSLTIPSSSTSIPRTRSLDDLTTPLLGDDEPHETSEQKNVEEDRQVAGINVEQVLNPIERDDSRRRKMGTRERMLDLRKKMSEKFEEKKRHIEEKGRNFVDKMRER